MGQSDQHDHRECYDEDCSRYPCVVFKEGYRKGWADGYDEGYGDGFAAGSAAKGGE